MPGYYWAYRDRSEGFLSTLLANAWDDGLQAIANWMDAEKAFKKTEKKKINRKKIAPRDWRRVYARLKRRGLVEDRKVGDRVMIRLTEEGFVKIWRARIRAAKSQVTGPDLCVVIFDIPEDQKNARDMFRYFLKQCDFKQLQRSVWVCAQSMAGEVKTFIKQIKLERWVRVIEGRVTL